MAKRRILYSKNETFSDTKRSEESDWSDLHPDLIYLISRKLTDISDFVRFRVVCKRWRSAVGASDLAPQLPWIVDDSENFEEGYLRFYSLLTGKTYTVNVPHSTDKSVRESAYNYLLTCIWQTEECSLFNPLTNEELSLPRPRIPFARCVPSVLSPDQSSRYVCMTSPPTTSITRLFFCQLGDLNWTNILLVSYPEEGSINLNTGFALNDGMCYANDRDTDSTKVINLATRTVVCVVPRPETKLGVLICLVVSSGEILRVCQYHMCSSEITEKLCYFDIYRLEFGNRDGSAINPCWIKIDNIGNQFLFLHKDHGCAFRADDFPGFIGNSIYFSKWKFEERTFELSRYDMKDGEIEVLHVPVKLGRCWFVPSLCKQSSNYQS